MGGEGTRRGSVQEVAFELRIEGGEGASSKGRFQVKNTPNSGDSKGQGPRSSEEQLACLRRDEEGSDGAGGRVG